MTFPAYRLLSRLLRPLLHAYLVWLGRKDPAYRMGIEERWGWGDYRSVAQGSVWVHAASVGEVRAAQPLIDRLLRDGLPLFITTNTPTGRQTAEERYGSDIVVRFPPVDVPDAVDRFLDKIRPSAALFVELELWPNRLVALAKRDVPTALVNARLSQVSFRRYARFGRLMSQCLEGVVCIAAQTDADGDRYRKMGVPDQRVRVTGNLKFDQSINDHQIRLGRGLRSQIGRDRPVWVAASLRQAEAPIVREAHELLRARYPNALLIAVPRHPGQFTWPASEMPLGDSERSVRDRHLLISSELHDDEPVAPVTRVVVADTYGEMIRFLSAADIAFVGGTLTPVGGHNPLEPASLAKPILMGPNVTNFRQIDGFLGRCGGRIRVHSATELADALISLFRDSHYLTEVGKNARQLVEEHRGATERTMGALQGTLFSDQRFLAVVSNSQKTH